MSKFLTDTRCEELEQREGATAAALYARRGMEIYRRSVLRSQKRGFDRTECHHCSFPEFREAAIRCYLAMRRYWYGHKDLLNKSEES